MGKPEAIILIPGLRRLKRGEELSRLIDGLKGAVDRIDFSESGDAEIPGVSGKRLQCCFRDTNEEKELDIYECFYGDLVSKLEEETPFGKMQQGALLILYWTFSGIWKALRRNTYLSLSVIFTAIAILLWYMGVLVVGFTAIGKLSFDPQNAIMQKAAELIGGWGEWMTRWDVWIAIGAILTFLGIGKLANLSHFVRLYLEDTELRSKVRGRVIEVLYRTVTSKRYARVTLLAHSFGAVIGVDVMADFSNGEQTDVRFFAIGSPLGVLSDLKPWVKSELNKCEENQDINSWMDFYSTTDYMCSHIKLDNTVYPFESKNLEKMGAWLKRITGETHLAYFFREEVISGLVS